MRSAFAAAVAALVAVGLVSWRHAPVDAQTPPAPRVVKIVGETHKLMLRSDGTVAGWGRFANGQLGPLAGITATNYGAAHLVTIELPGPAVDVAAATSTSYAVLEDGSVVAWGRGDSGQLGIGPVTLPLLASSTQATQHRGMERPGRVVGISEAIAIAAGSESAYVVLRDGTVRAWGRNTIGDDRAPKSYSGPPSTKGPAFLPVPVPGLDDIVAVSATDHVLALRKDGRVFSWGSNHYGALGRPPRQELPIDTAGEVPGLTDVVQAVAGLGVSTALKKDGTVWVWGANWHSQFGFGPRTDPPGPTHGYVLEPQRVPGVEHVTAVAVGRTGRHTLALLEDGTIRGWGNTDWGQLGSGMGPGFHERPITPKLSGVVSIHAAGNNSFAITRDGTFWAWGVGNPGEFPLTSNIRVPAPAPAGLK